MDEPLYDDWLDTRLRDETSYIDDAGFTKTIVQQLPAGRRHTRSMRAVILLGVTILATLIAYFVTGRGEVFANTAAYLVAMPFVTVCAIAGACAMFVMVISTYVAIAKTGELRR